MAVNLAMIAKVYIWSLFSLLRSPCSLCATPTSHASGLCTGCLTDLPTLPGPLCRCALPIPGTALTEHDDLAPLCGHCLHQPPTFLGIQTPFVYAHPLDRMINDWKHRRRLHMQRPLQYLLDQGLTALPDVDAVVPIPLHWQRQWQRGFNQATLLALALAHRHGLRLLPALSRPSAGRHQQGSSARDRRRAHPGMFVCRTDVRRLRILLVDDVITTATTVRAASDALLNAGAESVSVVALCRVLPPSAR
ncbi:MAG: ComF family protein [Alcanivoracaceae bacterium]|jgi:ComF family protein|nr:ComF family protein [Alcanivoracaceae bacterium]